MSKDIAFILYNTPDHSEKVQVVIKEETLWMTQKAMGELFGCSADNIGVHLKNIFAAGELEANSVTEKISATASDGKNYLDEPQIRRLERAVTGFFDYIEDLIEEENTFTMQQFAESVNEFLSFRRYKILPNKGRVSKEEADAKAEQEYTIFNKTQVIDSDFDKELKLLLTSEEGSSNNQ